MADHEVEKALSVPDVRYSRVWEDHRMLSRGLEIGSEDVVLCITSAGDNVLNLLLDGPKRMIAIDLSVAQNALLELKLAGIRCLCYEDYLILLGEVEDPGARWPEIYETVKQEGNMPSYALDYWHVHSDSLRREGSWCGLLEKYILSEFSETLHEVVANQQIDVFFSAKSLEEQRKIFDQMPLDDLKKFICHNASSRSQLKGRHQAQLKQVEISSDEMSEMTWMQLKRVCRDIPVQDNFYLSWWLRGQRGYNPLIRPHFCSPYVTKQGFTRLKGLVDRVEIHTECVEKYLTHPSVEITKACLSNIFEYMTQEGANRTFALFASHLSMGGRLAFVELFCPRLPSASFLCEQQLSHCKELSERLFKEARLNWFFALQVLERK